jgi:uncharacterized membrane protein
MIADSLSGTGLGAEMTGGNGEGGRAIRKFEKNRHFWLLKKWVSVRIRRVLCFFMFNPKGQSMSQNSSQNESGNKGHWGGNPFAAPGVEVDEIRKSGEYGLLPEPNRLPAGVGLAWISEGWALMQGHIGAWIGMGVVFFLVSFVLGLVPFFGAIALALLTPVLLAGTALACRAKEQEGEMSFTHLFAGFSNRVGALMMLGVIYFLIAFSIGLIFAVVAGLMVGFGALSMGALSAMLNADSGGSLLAVGGGMLLVFLLSLLVLALFLIPLIIVQWLSPPLVALHEDLTAWEAYKLALRGVLRNLLPFTVYGIVITVLSVLTVFTLGLGLLILFPLCFCTIYAAYRDIFIRQT